MTFFYSFHISCICFGTECLKLCWILVTFTLYFMFICLSSIVKLMLSIPCIENYISSTMYSIWQNPYLLIFSQTLHASIAPVIISYKRNTWWWLAWSKHAVFEKILANKGISDRICSFNYVSLVKHKSGQKNLNCAASNFYFLGPNIFFSTLFSNSLSLCSCLNVGDNFHTITKQRQNYNIWVFQFLYCWIAGWTQKFLNQMAAIILQI